MPFVPTYFTFALASGSPAGTEIHRDLNLPEEPDDHRFWFTGPDAALFWTLAAEANTGSGYDLITATLRPLPARTYVFESSFQDSIAIPCNFVQDVSFWYGTLTVTAPEGTVHEAFFDPAASGSAVGFNGSAGVLEPAGFSRYGVQTNIESLKWESGVVTMELSHAVSLAGGSMDFIALDGSVSLSLAFDDAQPLGENGVPTWNVPHQPWQDGDQLMLRIVGACPQVEAPNQVASM